MIFGSCHLVLTGANPGDHKSLCMPLKSEDLWAWVLESTHLRIMNTDKAVLEYNNLQAVSVYDCLRTPLISFSLIHVSVKLYKWWTPRHCQNLSYTTLSYMPYPYTGQSSTHLSSPVTFLHHPSYTYLSINRPIIHQTILLYTLLLHRPIPQN